MCGIAGVIMCDPREAEAAVTRMMPAMIHRGPDDAGQVCLPVRIGNRSAVAAFGFRRLAILDLSPAGHQPMHNEATGDWIVFNGEIYNFAQLREELLGSGSVFRSTSDTEVLLHALGRWGDAALGRIEGMYAVAFYRARDQQVLLARDPLGIKPLYVARTAGQVAFASEIRTLLSSGVVPRDIDVEGVASMLAFGSMQAPRTIFSGVEEFPSGHSQWIGQPVRRFWSFPQMLADPLPDAEASTRSLVQAAVRRHLVADVPVGIFLSAGIDSTLIAACAARENSAVRAFTVGIGPSHPDDETAVAADTARRLGIPHEVVHVDTTDLPQRWQRWIDALDSPSIDGFNTYLVTHALARRGIKVGISGLGADELFGGYPVFRSAPSLGRLIQALRWLPKTAVHGAARFILTAAGRSAVAEKVADVLAGPGDLPTIALGMRRITSDARLRAIVRQTGIEPFAAQPDGSDSSAADDDFNAVSRGELGRYMKNTLLRDSDANSMSHSLELRVPFLDQPLVEHVLALPGRVKDSRRGPRKQLLRSAFRDQLPHAVARRPKTGFTLPVSRWMRGDMREFCENAIQTAAGLPCMDAQGVTATWRLYLRSPSSLSWASPFALVVLGAYWARTAES